MISQFIQIIDGWHGVAQFIFIVILASFLTAAVLKLLELIGNFVNSLPILLRGWPKKTDDADILEELDEDKN